MTDPRLHLLIERLSHVLREERRVEATRYGLALAQLDALHFLAVANRFSDNLSSVGAYLGATKGTVSQTLSALVRKGLVRRTPDPHDGRVHHCRPTPAGRALVRTSLKARGLGPNAGDAPTVELLESLLREMIGARGGVAFGVCRTCTHHEPRARGGWCRLLQVPLSEVDAGRLCREHERAVA